MFLVRIAKDFCICLLSSISIETAYHLVTSKVFTYCCLFKNATVWQFSLAFLALINVQDFSTDKLLFKILVLFLRNKFYILHFPSFSLLPRLNYFFDHFSCKRFSLYRVLINTTQVLSRMNLSLAAGLNCG